jgi:type 1 glutamine amidotransferase
MKEQVQHTETSRSRVLVLCDDQWHPAADVQRGFNAQPDGPFAFEFLTDGGQWSLEQLLDYSVVVIAKANHRCATNQSPWLTAGTQGALDEFVQSGGGLFLIHGGTCYKDWPLMRSLTGGAFLRHPDQCPVTIEPTRVHSLTAGVSSFVITDEHYFMTLDAKDADVFLETRSKHGVQPAGWTRREDKGRICVLTPGHNVEVWLHPEFQKLLRNGLNWLAPHN